MSESILVFPELTESEPPGSKAIEVPREKRMATLEAVIFAAETPPSLTELAAGLGLPEEELREDLDRLCRSYRAEDRGVEIRPVAGGYRMYTKVEHHASVRSFASSMRPRVTLSRAAVETLAIVAYRQPVTVPEIGAVRGVASASGVIHTLLRQKLIATAGRKNVIGRPILYKTTDEFLKLFGLNDLSELPTMKELEDLGVVTLDGASPSGPSAANASPGSKNREA